MVFNQRIRCFVLALNLLAVGLYVSPILGQDDDEDEEGPSVVFQDIPIIERDPFDLLILDSASDDAQLQVVPFEFPNREVPTNRPDTEMLLFRLIDDESTILQVAWRNVINIRFYEEMLLEEAIRLMDVGEMDNAFRHLNRVLSEYPNTDGAELAFLRFLYVDGQNRLQDGNLESALSVFEELYGQEPTYRPDDDLPTVNEQISNILDQILGAYIEDRNYRFARIIMSRVETKYRDAQAHVLQRWNDAIRAHAEEHRDEALGFVDQGEGRKAHEAIRKMLNVLPEIDGGIELANRVMEQYPLILVAVDSPARSYDPRSIENWSAKRVGRMCYRSLVEFQGQGQDGGQYRFPHGRIIYGDDGTSFTLELTQFEPTPGLPAVDAYQVSRRILDRALPSSFDYQQGWRRILHSVEIESVDRVKVQLAQPHVLPEALLQISFDPRIADDQVLAPNGAYSSKPSRDPGALFEPNPSYDELLETRSAEIVELSFSRAEDAITALLRGDVDVIDRIFPGDIKLLQDSEGVEVQAYQVPTVHMLIPNLRTEHMKNPMFRLGLLMGIDRQSILSNTLLGGIEQTGFEVISGPFPIGVTDADPVNYGYDFSIDPKPYDHQLAGTIVLLAENASKRMLESIDQELPPRPTLILAHPDNELATAACNEIASKWQLIGVDCELRKLGPGQVWPDDENYDLVYSQISMSEPLVEARLLLAENGIVGTESGSIDLSLRALDVANSWPAARRQLYELHAFVHNETIVLPLYQTVEHFAYRTHVRGIGRRLISLYDNVTDWRILTEAPTGVASQ